MCIRPKKKKCLVGVSQLTLKNQPSFLLIFLYFLRIFGYFFLFLEQELFFFNFSPIKVLSSKRKEKKNPDLPTLIFLGMKPQPNTFFLLALLYEIIWMLFYHWPLL